MRKSSRDTRKPELFTFKGRSPVGTTAEESEDDSVEDGFGFNKKENIKLAKSTKKDTLGSQNIVDMVRANRNPNTDIIRWINSFERDKVAAMVELVNFLLMAAGAQQHWIASDVDLEALEPEELDVLLQDMMKTLSESENSKIYPLNEKSKGKTTPFRDKFQTYWIRWVERVLSLPITEHSASGGSCSSSSSSSSSARGGGAGRTTTSVEVVLRTVVDQLVALSSMAVVNIRDVVTEAALSVSQALLAACGELKAELATVQRQLGAEESSHSKAAARQNPKYQACLKQQVQARERLQVLHGFATTLFNSVFVHRAKDFHEAVRTTATRHLKQFVCFDVTPNKPLRVEYLKYLGWACSDYAATVRLEAVDAIGDLVEDPQIVPYLQNFVEHFMPRFVQIAACDIDDDVALSMIEALRLMQQNGLLDQVSEETLDAVDVIVFDPEAAPRIRQEALAFLMDHTEGFEEEEEEEEEDNGRAGNAAGRKPAAQKSNSSTTKNKSKSKKAAAVAAQAKLAVSNQSNALARRQRTTLQIETLTEFAEHHLGDNLQWAHMLAESCLALNKYDMLYNWPTSISLLLRESDANVSSALRPSQATILLRMFVYCAVDLNQKRLNSSSGNVHHQESWQYLNENLLTHLPALITRFRDEESNLTVLVELLDCCDFSGNDKALKSILKVVMGMFQTIRQESILAKLVGFLRGCLDTGGVMAGTVEEFVQQVISSSWDAILVQADNLSNIVEEGQSDAAVGKAASSKGAKAKGAKKRKSSSTGGSVATSSSSSKTRSECEEVLLYLQNAITKFRLFWERMDCRKYVAESVEELSEKLAEICELIPSMYASATAGTEDLAVMSGLSDSLTHACITSAIGAATTLNSTILWSYKDVIELGRELASKRSSAAAAAAGKNRRKQSKSGEEEKQDPVGACGEEGSSTTSATAVTKAEAKLERSIAQAVDRVIVLREKLVDVLLSWINTSSSSTPEDEDSSHGGNTSLNRSFASSQSAGVSETSGCRMDGRHGVGGRAGKNVLRALQLDAFRLVSDLRSFFPVRETNYRYIDRLAFTPSQEVLAGLRRVFDSEGSRIKSELLAIGPLGPGAVAAGDNNNSTHRAQSAKALSSTLVDSLILPLSQTLVFDVQHLNRRQAAAVFYYILDANEQIEQAVKLLMRRLKEADLVKYLEIQLVAVKGLFVERVGKLFHARAMAADAEENGEPMEEEAYDAAANEQMVLDGYRNLDTFARKMAQSLGIAKLKDAGLLALVNFFKASIDFATSNGEVNLGFVSCLAPYVRFLPPVCVREVSEHFRATIDAHPVISEELQVQREISGGPSVEEYVRLADFEDHMLGKGKPRMNRRKSSVSTFVTTAEEEGEEEEHADQSFASQRHLLPAVNSQIMEAEDIAMINANRASTAHRSRASSSFSGRPTTKTSKSVSKSAAASAASFPHRGHGGDGSDSSRHGGVEDDIEDPDSAEDSVNEEENPSVMVNKTSRLQQQKTQQARVKKQPDVAFGLDIEDGSEDIEDEEEEEEEEEEEDQMLVETTTTTAKKRTYSQRVLSGSSKRDTQMEEEALAELQSIPTRRRFR